MIFEEIVSHANDIVIVAETGAERGGFRIAYVNRAFETTFGYEASEVIGCSPRMLQGEGTDPATVQEISVAVHNGVCVRRRLLNYAKSGRPVWVEVNIVPLPNKDGEITHFAAIERDVTADVEREHALEDMALTDPLTRAGNRRYFDQTLERELRQALSSGKPLTLGVLDLDHFKNVNDKHGHPAGDLVLVGFAAVVRRMLRNYDHIARIGGEEFAVVLPGASTTQALEVMERVCARLRTHPIAIASDKSLAITCSAGVAELQGDGDDVAGLLARADEALYRAKREGRDCVRRAA